MVETRAQKVSSWALAKFHDSKEYEDELADAGADAFQLEFVECKKQVCRLVSKVDLSSLQPDKESDESGDEEAEAEEDHLQPTSWIPFVCFSIFSHIPSLYFVMNSSEMKWNLLFFNLWII